MISEYNSKQAARHLQAFKSLLELRLTSRVKTSEVQQIVNLTLKLTYHAALPVVITPELLHLLRINFFNSSQEFLDYTAEADILLSSLCAEMADDIYEINIGIRKLLIERLEQTYGAERKRQVAALLQMYIEKSSAWIKQPQLELAQSLTALSYLEPARVKTYLADIEKNSAIGDEADKKWVMALGKEIDFLVQEPVPTRPRKNPALDQCTFAVLNMEGREVGSGFMVGPRLGVTCAHVAQSAFRMISGNLTEPFGGELIVRDNQQKLFKTRLLEKGWSPPEQEDVAFIQFLEEPGILQPAILGRAERSAGHQFRSFGYPIRRSTSEWVLGQIDGLVEMSGGRPRLQLSLDKTVPGFSGSPVLDNDMDRVVGMIGWGKEQKHGVMVLAVPAKTLKDQWPELEISEGRKAPFMVEQLPANFVPRPSEFEAIVSAVLEGENSGPVGITAALRGVGGFGKTTLARAVCLDPRVREAFPDGILWVTLGENCSESMLVAKLGDLIRVLEGEWKGYSEINPAAANLRALLRDRRALLVIDDVWRAANLRPFLQVDSQCVVLVTTRNDDALPSGTHKINVDAMRQSEAVHLLTTGLPEGEEIAAGQLASMLGDWPLLLNLANGVLRRRISAGQGLKEAFTYVLQVYQRRGLMAFETRDATQREEAVALTLEVSLSLLKPNERVMYTDLAVFAENIDIPLRAIETLWGMGEYETEELCQYLTNHSLVLRFDLNNRTIRMHDVIQRYLVLQQDLPALHKKLLDAYRIKCSGGWHTGPQDGYFYRWLAYHLARAKIIGELEDLLLDFRWMNAHLRATNFAELLEDYAVGIGVLQSEAIHLVQATLRLSGHVLTRDPDQLAGQLMDRLAGVEDEKIVKLLEQAGIWLKSNLGSWLRPLQPSLEPPGTGLVATLIGHDGQVLCVAASSDGQLAVSGSSKGEIKVWKLSNGQEVRTIETNTGAITSIILSPDGHSIISAFNSGIILVWDLESGQKLRNIEGHDSDINAIAITPDGRKLVSASGDHTVRIWDFQTNQEIYNLQGHTAKVNAVAISPDGHFVVSGSTDDTIKIWDLEIGKELRSLQGHTDQVTSVAISPDGRLVISGAADKTIKIWDLQSGQELRTLQGHTGDITSVVISPDGRQVISASSDDTLGVWNLESGRLVRSFTGHSEPVDDAVITTDGRLVVSASADGTIKLWDLANKQDLLIRNNHADGVSAIAISPDGSLAVSASRDTTLKVFDLVSSKERLTLRGHSDRITAVAISPDNRLAVSASWDNTLKIWDLASGQERYTLVGHRGPVNSVAISLDGRLAISASKDTTLKVWDLASGQERYTLTGHTDAVTTGGISSDGGLIISGSRDGTIKVWDLNSGQVRLTMTGHQGAVNSIVISLDGRVAISTASDSTLIAWDLATGQTRYTLSGLSKTNDLTALSPDGSLLLANFAGNILKIMRPDSGEELHILKGHSSTINAISISKNSRLAVSGSLDRKLIVWDLASGEARCEFTCNNGITACQFDPVDRIIVAGDRGGMVYFLALEGF